MDDITRYNQERWEELARRGVPFSRPKLDMDQAAAREAVDGEGVMGEVGGKDVLGLAAGGGKQSAAFALLGANVTILDFSTTQLERDREACAHYGVEACLVQGDMRGLSCLRDDSFDLVWQAHSLNFVADREPVLDGIARVLRPGGLYRLEWTNPFVHGIWDDWDERGYHLSQPYMDGAEVDQAGTDWDFEDGDGVLQIVRGPREFRHTLGGVANGLIARGFTLLGLWEHLTGDIHAEPGSWRHFESIAPPWLTVWARLW
jgi:SAM-dependent methyltransferase